MAASWSPPLEVGKLTSASSGSAGSKTQARVIGGGIASLGGAHQLGTASTVYTGTTSYAGSLATSHPDSWRTTPPVATRTLVPATSTAMSFTPSVPGSFVASSSPAPVAVRTQSNAGSFVSGGIGSWWASSGNIAPATTTVGIGASSAFMGTAMSSTPGSKVFVHPPSPAATYEAPSVASAVRPLGSTRNNSFTGAAPAALHTQPSVAWSSWTPPIIQPASSTIRSTIDTQPNILSNGDVVALRPISREELQTTGHLIIGDVDEGMFPRPRPLGPIIEDNHASNQDADVVGNEVEVDQLPALISSQYQPSLGAQHVPDMGNEPESYVMDSGMYEGLDPQQAMHMDGSSMHPEGNMQQEGLYMDGPGMHPEGAMLHQDMGDENGDGAGSQMYYTVLPVPDDYYRLLHNHLDEIQEMTGCRIEVEEPKADSLDWEMLIYGNQEARRQAHEIIENTIGNELQRLSGEPGGEYYGQG